MSEHAVIYRLVPGAGFDLDDLETKLESAAGTVDAEYDGNVLALDGSEAILYLYGGDADALYDATAAAVRNADIAQGSHAVKRYGSADDPSAREERVDLR